jgi:hypothetical protein
MSSRRVTPELTGDPLATVSTTRQPIELRGRSAPRRPCPISTPVRTRGPVTCFFQSVIFCKE